MNYLYFLLGKLAKRDFGSVPLSVGKMYSLNTSPDFYMELHGHWEWN